MSAEADYQQLAAKSAAARRNGGFPALVDSTRSLARMQSWESVGDALDERVQEFRLDHSLGQEYDLYVFVEKAARIADIESTNAAAIKPPP